MKTFTETVPADDAAKIQKVVDLIIAKQRQGHKKGQFARRDVHIKGYLVEALFQVLPDLPEHLRVGVFEKACTYRASIRCSAGLLGPNAYDILPNTRAAALKLHGVPGKKLRLGDENSSDHDFLLVNGPVFQVASLDQYIMVQEQGIGAALAKMPQVIWPLLKQVSQIVRNPFKVRYFSQAAYLFGDRACKYMLIPKVADSFWPLPDAFDPDYLRHAVEAELQRGPMELMFCVQFQQDGESVEDPTQEWKGVPVPLARLVLPQAQPGSYLAILKDSGEQLSFDPWRVLPEHEPLGWVGRARRAAYKADFEWRTRTNDGNVHPLR